MTDDVAALRPSIFAAVPRVLDRMKSGIEAKIKRQPGWKQRLFRAAYNVKRFMRRLGRFDFVGHLPVMCMNHSLHCVTCGPNMSPCVLVSAGSSPLSALWMLQLSFFI